MVKPKLIKKQWPNCKGCRYRAAVCENFKVNHKPKTKREYHRQLSCMLRGVRKGDYIHWMSMRILWLARRDGYVITDNEQDMLALEELGRGEQ